ncbi:uncharacterized protein SOCE26_074580 [Sorangium cellulosum]|uniref:Uncharacterized protein n=1 Tax=Sorangium cellulosum TaxID=56 RepID=A0A2L0F339_SORCE|nr:uncharacterized protein SOCE26_074580 [Sorangium cellulosum]
MSATSKGPEPGAKGVGRDLAAPLPPLAPPKVSWWGRLVDFVFRRKKKRTRLTSTVYPLR